MRASARVSLNSVLHSSRPKLALSVLFALTTSVGCGQKSMNAASCGKVQINNTHVSQAKATTSNFKQGTPFVAVIKDSCANPGAIAASIENRYEGETHSGVRSYTWTLPQDLSLDEITQMANDDSCVSLITDLDADIMSQQDSEGHGDVEITALPNDPKVNLQKHLTAIGASEAYDTFYDPTNGIKKEVVIAILDSGVRLTHEDLRGHLWVNEGEIPNNGIDDDHNGYVDDVYGYNFASHLPDPTYEKTSKNSAWQWAHGTKVAGLAAAIAGNGRGVLGVMGTAKIMSLNTMGKDTKHDHPSIANAIRYAVDNGAHVINMSIGGFTATSTDYRNALKYATSKGVVVLAAAGNEKTQISSSYSAAGNAAAIAGLLSIGNLQAANFKKSTTSNFSTTYVELGAPGTYTMATKLLTTSPSSDSGYSEFSGTSAATPVASGAAALAIGLIKSRGYMYTAGDIERLLLDSADHKETLSSYFKDGNSLNLAKLAQLVDERYPAGRIVAGDDGAYNWGEEDENHPPQICEAI